MLEIAYGKGYKAYIDGRAILACPYVFRPWYEAWLLGWATALRERRAER